MDPETILEFWFADAAADPKKAAARNPFWYEGTPETDTTSAPGSPTWWSGRGAAV